MIIWEYQERVDQIQSSIRKKEEELEELSHFYREVKQGKNEFLKQVLKKKQILFQVLERRDRNSCVIPYNSKMETELDDSFQKNVLKEYQKVLDQIMNEKRQLSDSIGYLEEEQQYYFRRIEELEWEEKEKN